MSEGTTAPAVEDASRIWTRIESRLTRVQPRFPAEEVELVVARWDAPGER